MQTELYLIRHGETNWNTERRMQGHLDSPLTDKGIAQAEEAAEFLRSHSYHVLYSSDLPRTLQTAKPIALATGLTVIAEPGLRERNLGIFEGLTEEEIEARHAADFARFKAREPEFVIPNGESLKQLHLRCVTVMENLARRHAGQRVLVVSHGALITAFMRHLSGIPLETPTPFFIRNGSVSHVLFTIESSDAGGDEPGTWSIITHGGTFRTEIAA